MKIGFMGAGGTGKSTTAKALAEATGLPLMISPSRECFAKRGVLTEDEQYNMSPEGRLLLQQDIFQAITEQCLNNEKGIFERTNLDNLFYGLFRCSDVLSRHEAMSMLGISISMLQTFNLVVCFPLYPNWPDPDDGMRTVKFGGRLLMDGFLKAFKTIPRITIVMRDEPVEKRVQHIMDHMG